MSQECEYHLYKTLLGKLYLVKEFILSLESQNKPLTKSRRYQLEVSLEKGI